MRSWIWVTLVVLVILGAVLLFQSNQPTTQPGQEGVGGGPGVLMSQRMEINLDPVAKDQSGKAVLEEKDGKVTVTLDVSKIEGSNNQPAHIHAGSCPGIGEVIFPLNNVVDGKSVTVINTTLGELKSQSPLAINIHQSAEEISVYTTCGNLLQ